MTATAFVYIGLVMVALAMWGAVLCALFNVVNYLAERWRGRRD